MVTPERLSRAKIAEAPYEVWNAFVRVAFQPYEELNEIQRIAHLTLWYESEITNGGHLQYFENHGTDRADEVQAALRAIGANCQANVLAAALTQRQWRKRKRIRFVESYVKAARQGEYDEFDTQFYNCDPEITTLLEAWLDQHESEFVKRVD